METKKTDKAKTQLSTISIPNVTTTRFYEKMVGTSDYVYYGDDNKFPQYLLNQFYNCPTHQSIVEGISSYISGSGVTSTFSNEILNKDGETIDDIVTKLALDFILFNGFALQIIYNKKGDVSEIYWTDFSTIRTNTKRTKFFWSNDWSSGSKSAIKYDPFNKNAKNKKSQIFYYTGRGCRSVYPIPRYISALDAIQTEIDVQSYHLNNINNSFAASVVINMNNGVPEKEDKDDMEAKIIGKFAGKNNAGKILISWNEDKDAATTVDRLDSVDFSDKFARLSKDTQKSIFIAHRVTSPSLFGVIPENTGFSKQEYNEAFQIFNITVISPMQKEIERAISSIYEKPIKIEPFKIDSYDVQK